MVYTTYQLREICCDSMVDNPLRRLSPPIREPSSLNDTMANTIPVIDFNRWIKGSEEEKRGVAQDLTDACRRVGFVYVVNHLVQDELLEEAFQWSNRLFSLPQDKKMLAPHPPGISTHLG